MKITATATAYGLLQSQITGADFVWPSKYDSIEDIYSLQQGYIHHGFTDPVNPCSFGTNVRGVQNAAEWVRVAYHDMSTHDVNTGTGGLDASIQFETERDENEGSAFSNTLGFFSNFHDAHTPMADLMALGLVAATAMCGGPKVALRLGRVDATEAGPWGVPKPDQDIEHHKGIFAKQGFNTEEMITMVACGHTLGGVHHEDFPQIVGDPDATVGNVTQFEGNSSAYRFDNTVVTEYLDGSTPNPLVVGHNDTTNSDKRVFGADGNKTMRALADPAAFQAKCADIFARMIDTVPASVTLTAPLEAFDIKPYIEKIALNSNGTIDFSGRIRVRVNKGTDRDGADLEAKLAWTDRSGAVGTIQTTKATLLGGHSVGLFGETFQWFEFSTTMKAGISKFNVELTVPSTGTVTVHDNAGHGFPIEDSFLFQQDQSCMNVDDGSKPFPVTVTAAVHKERAQEAVQMELAHKVAGPLVNLLEIRPVSMTKTNQTVGDYVLFRTEVPLETSSWSTTFDLVLGEGDSASRIVLRKTGSLANTCKSL